MERAAPQASGVARETISRDQLRAHSPHAAPLLPHRRASPRCAPERLHTRAEPSSRLPNGDLRERGSAAAQPPAASAERSREHPGAATQRALP